MNINSKKKKLINLKIGHWMLFRMKSKTKKVGSYVTPSSISGYTLLASEREGREKGKKERFEEIMTNNSTAFRKNIDVCI